MSTLVITHANEYLACFTQEQDGEMRQQALIHTGPQAPTALEMAELGNEFAARFGWNGYKQLPAAATPKPLEIRSVPRKQLLQEKKAAGKKSRRKVPGSHPGQIDPKDKPDTRIAKVLEYLREHPGSRREAIAAAIYGENCSYRLTQRLSNTLATMRVEGLITQVQDGNYRRYLYSVRQG